MDYFTTDFLDILPCFDRLKATSSTVNERQKHFNIIEEVVVQTIVKAEKI